MQFFKTADANEKNSSFFLRASATVACVNYIKVAAILSHQVNTPYPYKKEERKLSFLKENLRFTSVTNQPLQLSRAVSTLIAQQTLAIDRQE